MFEPYLTKLPISLAISVFRFRTANHKFPIEIGRWQGTPRVERKCTKCNLDSTGDEMHYFFTCTYFSTLRHKFLTESYNNNTFNFQKILAEKKNREAN